MISELETTWKEIVVILLNYYQGFSGETEQNHESVRYGTRLELRTFLVQV